MRRHHLLTTSLLLIAACGAGSGAASPPGEEPDAGEQEPPSGHEVVGSIDVREVRSVIDDGGGPALRQLGHVGAWFAEGPSPSAHREAMRDGDCTLSTFTPVSCTAACTGVGICLETDVCTPFPRRLSAGTVVLAGLADRVELEPQEGAYFPPQVPDELFADAAVVTATLAGDDVAAATLEAPGVAPIDASFEDGTLVVPYPAEEDVAIRWTPAGDGSRVRVTLNANNQGHGLPYLGIVSCDVADAAGEVVLPAAMLDAFPATEAWRLCAGTDCPPSTVARYRRGAVAVGTGREIELVVASQVSFGVEHRRP